MASAVPGQSMPGRSGAVDSGTRNHAAQKATTPIGMLTRKMVRQSSPYGSQAISAPPASGPVIAASPTTAPNTANALPRASAGNTTWMVDSTCGNINPLAIPWITRAATSVPIPVAMPLANDAEVNVAMPMRKSRLRP